MPTAPPPPSKDEGGERDEGRIIRVRVETPDYQELSGIAKDKGLPLSTFVRTELKQIINRERTAR